MEINVDGVSITLTKKQLESINNQKVKFKSYKDITTFELACEYLKKDPTKYKSSFKKIKIIVKALNKLSGFITEWEIINQYYPYFKINNGSFVFANFNSNRGVIYFPSTLYVSSSEEAIFLGEKFTDLYKDYLLN